MSLPLELLEHARRLVTVPAPTDADLRRAISATYYALFHHLIDAAVAHLLPTGAPDQRAALAHGFEHSRMREVCQRVTRLSTQPNPNPLPPAARVLGGTVPNELARVAEAFDFLQRHRFDADYDRVPPVDRISLAGAQGALTQVETAFADWAHLEAANAPLAQAFLVLLLTGDLKSR